MDIANRLSGLVRQPSCMCERQRRISMKTHPNTEFFNQVTELLLEDETVSRGTMMGFPCLRVNSAFFASADHRTGDLIVKLSKEHVAALIDEGTGRPFAPAGRTFREWVVIPDRDQDRWTGLLGEALLFVSNDESS